jgi:hypothetical protein
MALACDHPQHQKRHDQQQMLVLQNPVHRAAV